MVAKTALAERKTIRAVVIEQGFVERGDLTEEQLDQALDVLSMTHPRGRPAQYQLLACLNAHALHGVP
jgi:aspartate ammonia-lyase